MAFFVSGQRDLSGKNTKFQSEQQQMGRRRGLETKTRWRDIIPRTKQEDHDNEASGESNREGVVNSIDHNIIFYIVLHSLSKSSRQRIKNLFFMIVLLVHNTIYKKA